MRWYGLIATLRLPACALALALALGSPARGAEDGATWRLLVSPYTLHFRPNPDHKPVWAVGLEREGEDGWLLGAAYFSNSFGQDSGYGWIGRRYFGLLGQPELFFHWSAGLMYGYRGKYENKVPFNSGGFSPGALVSLGWVFDPKLSAQVSLLGDAGLMFQLNVTVP
jgi:hypothetical protein